MRVFSVGLMSVVLSTILSLSAIFSGIGTAKADSVIATIPVGISPFIVAVNPNTGTVYVGNDDNTVSVISSSNQLIATIPVGDVPRKIAVNPNTGNVYVANAGSNTVSVISSSNQLIATIPVGMAPFIVAVNPNTGSVYVINVVSNTVSVISGSTNQVIATIPVGGEPEGVAVNPNTGNVYVANTGSSTVSVISSSNQIIATIPVGKAPRGIAVIPNTGNVYVGNEGSSTVSVISTAASSQLPHTTITSARDGDGATIQNGGTTLSTSIQLTFTATPGTNPIAGFECRLDNSAFSPCTSPTTLTNLPDGKHNIQVRAVDTGGNRDPTPASFSWTILTPAQGIQQLIQIINGMHLNSGIQAALDAQLNAILATLSSPSNNNVLSACPRLNAFTNTVIPGYLHAGQLNSNQAAQLIQAAQNIQTALGCIVASSVNGTAPSSSLSTSGISSLNLTHSQQQLPQTTASSPSSLQPQSQSPYPYTDQYRNPSQHPYLFQIPRSQPPENQQPPPVNQR